MEKECKFFTHRKCMALRTSYGCYLDGSLVSENNTQINPFKGRHETGKSNHDVTTFSLSNDTLSKDLTEVLSRSIQRHFTHLLSLSVINCGLKELLRRDFMGLQYLQDVNFSQNKIKLLGDNLFVDLKHLMRIDFSSNLLESLNSKLLVPIADNLEYVNLQSNTRLNDFYLVTNPFLHGHYYGCNYSNKYNVTAERHESIGSLMRKIDSECAAPIPRVDIDELLFGIKEIYVNGGHYSFKLMKLRDAEIKVLEETCGSKESSTSTTLFQVKPISVNNLCDWIQKCYVRYFNTGNPHTFTNALELFDIATQNEAFEVKSLCEDVIVENLTDENAFRVYMLGFNNSLWKLQKSAFDLLSRKLPIDTLDQSLMSVPSDFGYLMSTVNTFKSLDQRITIQRNHHMFKLEPASMTGKAEPGNFNIVSHFGEPLTVEYLVIEQSNLLQYFPRDLHKTFANVTVLMISRCELKEISKDDLMGLEHLEELLLPSNKLRELPDNLLTYMKKLRSIDFSNNLLQTFSSKLLEPVKELLEFAIFLNNPTINMIFEKNSARCDKNTIADFMREIDEKFTPLRLEALKTCENHFTAASSDFKIKAGSQEFAVSKEMLAAKSSVFAAMFRHNYQESQMNQMRIEDFSIKTVRALATYFNEGIAEDNECIVELYELAEKYNIPDLKSACGEVIYKHLDETTAFKLLRLANGYLSEDLRRIAFSKIESMLPLEKLDVMLMDYPEEMEELYYRKKLFDETLAKYQTSPTVKGRRSSYRLTKVLCFTLFISLIIGFVLLYYIQFFSIYKK